MKGQNEYFSGASPVIPVNTYTEYIGGYSGFCGYSVPIVRAWEESDPVYYMVDDAPLADLRARDSALATQISLTAGGVFSKDFWSFNNDTDYPFEYGIVGKVATSNFTSTATCKAYNQLIVPIQVKANYDVTVKIVYAMSTSLASKYVKLNFAYDMIKRTDSISAPTISNTLTDEIAVPGTTNVVETATFTIPSANLVTLGTELVGSTLAFMVERVNTGMTNPNHSGTFQVLGVSLYQTI